MEKRITAYVGLDVGDKFTEMCVLDDKGAVVDQDRIPDDEGQPGEAAIEAPERSSHPGGGDSLQVDGGTDRDLGPLGHRREPAPGAAHLAEPDEERPFGCADTRSTWSIGRAVAGPGTAPEPRRPD